MSCSEASSISQSSFHQVRVYQNLAHSNKHHFYAHASTSAFSHTWPGISVFFELSVRDLFLFSLLHPYAFRPLVWHSTTHSDTFPSFSRVFQSSCIWVIQRTDGYTVCRCVFVCMCVKVNGILNSSILK